MRRLSAVLIVAVALMAVPQPLVKATSRIVLQNPEPIPDYTPRVSRQRQRPTLTLQHLPSKWQRLAWCESRNRLHANRHNTYYGLWQIHKGWFKPFKINPETATLRQQFKIAQHVYERQGHKAWSCSNKANFH